MEVFDEKQNKLKKSTLSVIENLYRTSDNGLEIFYPIFPLVECIPMRVTKNVNVKLGIANGTSAKIFGAQFPREIDIDELHCSI